MIKKIFFLIITSAISWQVYSQPSFVRGDFGDGWNDYQMTERGAVKCVTINATATIPNTSFVFTKDLSYNPKWCGSLTNYARPLNQMLIDASYYYTGGAWDHDLTVPVSAGKYYTFISSKSAYANNNISVLETSFQPVSIVNVARNTAYPVQNNQVVVTAKLNSTKNAAENIFLRWTKDNWATCTYEAITTFDVNNEGTATIPGLSTGTNVSYYVLSTTQVAPVDSTIDYFSPEINNNGNSNYNYTVIATSGCPFSTDLGADVDICGGGMVVLDPGITVSPYGDSLTIIYDATKGISGLAGSPKVYMHAAAELHTNGGWQYTVGNWGMDDGVGEMTSTGNNKWKIKINPVTYFGYPADSAINGIFLVFRNSTGSLTGKDDSGNDIWINMKSSPVVSSFGGVMPQFLPNIYSSITWSDGSHGQKLVVSSGGTYSVLITNSIGGCSASDTVSISLNPIPYTNIGNDRVLCTGNIITLDAGVGFSAYNWSTGVTTQTLVVTSAGQYSVTVTGAGGCTGFDVVNISYEDQPVADFSYSINGMTVIFTDLSANGTTYGWDFNGNGVNESTVAGNVTYTYNAAGQYLVILTVSNGCGSDSVHKFVYIKGDGIGEYGMDNSFNIFPNPSGGAITIFAENPGNSGLMLDIINSTGKIILSDNIIKTNGDLKKTYTLPSLSKGVYLVRLKNNSENKYKKIIIE